MARLVVLVLLLGGCGSDDPAARVKSLADEVCACADAACATEKMSALERASREALENRNDRAAVSAITEANQRAMQCAAAP